MTKKEHRERITGNIRVMWADPYIKAHYSAQIYDLLMVRDDMHNRRLNPRRPDWAQPCTPALKAWLKFVYESTGLATEQIAQMYNVNQARVSDAVIGVRV
jgi:hypothetical protein